MREEVSAFCARIGADPLMVQAGGGNVSWKDDGVLHVKASGTWLAHAMARDIFVSVDMVDLRAALARGDYAAKPRLIASGDLRPSVETTLHAIMPQRVVAHVHAVEALAHLVKADARAQLAHRLGEEGAWLLCPYFMPGAELGQGVAAMLRDRPDAEVIFLANHGVIVGADDVETLERRLRDICAQLATVPRHVTAATPAGLPGLISFEDAEIQALAREPGLFQRVRRDWALYPDHVVFLGGEAEILAAAPRDMRECGIVFIPKMGVYAGRATTPSERAYLRCYADIVLRLEDGDVLNTLSVAQVGSLLNWDAEKYRKALAARMS